MCGGMSRAGSRRKNVKGAERGAAVPKLFEDTDFLKPVSDPWQAKLTRMPGNSGPKRPFDAGCARGRFAGLCCRSQRNVKPRIAGPWCGDPTSVNGTLWQPRTSRLSVEHDSSQIAVPGDGPAMRGGLRP